MPNNPSAQAPSTLTLDIDRNAHPIVVRLQGKEEMMVASTVSLTTLASIISLVVWLYELSGLAKHITAG
jgi:predicted permease